ncbi:MAG: diguanylate cyclase [Chloroflexi bacterium]|nr:diguanylate cyclase [Chloroflexota bacterium]
MTKRAWVYVIGWIIAGGILSAWVAQVAAPSSFPAFTFFAFLSFATIAQFLKVPAPNHQLYYLNTIFLFASALLLPPFWFVSIVIISLAIQWLKERLTGSPHLRDWYLQPFNMSTHIICGLVSSRLVLALMSIDTPLLSSTTVIAALAGALTYVVINHLAIGGALVLARGVTWRESGILEIENLLMDYVGLCMGYMLSVIWKIDAGLMVTTLAPLILVYRALAVPGLKKEAQTDGKTGLLNAHYFNKLFITEMDRAENLQHPLSVIMADLDLLRNINNSYGHLAGDAVLVGVAKIVRDEIRKYDLAGRFGGEEFCIALPETPLEEAVSIAERIRRAIESTGFKLNENALSINVTMSFGVASFPQDATAPNELIHQADVAVYQAKLQGRNCVVCSGNVPHSVKLEMPGVVNRLETAHGSTYIPKPTPIQIERPSDPSQQFEHEPQSSPAKGQSASWLGWLVGVVIGIAVLVSIGGFISQPRPDSMIVFLLMIMAGITQLPQLKNLAGDSTISVSVAINFAAAVLVGIPGVVFTSATIVIAHRLYRWNSKKGLWPVIYKTVYNWSIHVLAALTPAVVSVLLPTQLDIIDLIISLGMMTLAAIIYFGVETGLLVAAVSAEKSESPLKIWKDECAWLAPQYFVLCMIGFFLAVAYDFQGNVGILVFTIPVLMMTYSQKEYIDRTEKGVLELRRMNQELAGANSRVLEANVAIREMNEELLVTLAKMIDARDPYVSGHSAQVAEYATAIATELGFDEEHIVQVRQAAFFHDIGKIGISEKVLHKPTKLENQEYDYIKKHVAIGAQFLETCKGLRYLVPSIQAHHEWWNGCGYPNHLIGEQIPLDGRILAVCDAVEAMASDRPYHRALSLETIIAEIERCAGTQFDPQVAAAFIRVAKREGRKLVVNSARSVSARADVQAVPVLLENYWQVAL